MGIDTVIRIERHQSEPFRLRHVLIPLMCLVVIGYFAYHGINGRHGLLAWLSFQDEAVQLDSQLGEVRATRQRLEREVALLRPESLDPDLLDERARATLGLTHPNEITVFTDPE